MSKERAFTVFCLENYKTYRNLSGQEVALLFDRYGVFDYIREFYDVLHTTGHHYINNDILAERDHIPIGYACCHIQCA